MVNLKAGTRPPWVGLGSAVWVQIASGNAYNFPLYSHSLKSVLGFNQHQLTMLGVANDVGENVGLIPGIACNKLPPWVILLIGALACFFGYGVLWLAVSSKVQSMPYWLLWLALCVATNSSAWLSTAVLVTNMRNFPLSRGTVAGILKGYGGISAAVFTEIYSTLLCNSSSKLLMFLALGIPVLCFIVMYFVRPCTPALGEDSSEHAHFLFTQGALIVLGLYVLSTTILNHIFHFSALISNTFLVIMVVLLMAPFAIPIKMTFHRIRVSKPDQPVESSDSVIQEDSADKTEPLLKSSSSAAALGSFRENVEASEVAMLLAEGEGAVKKRRRPKRGEDFRFTEALIKADFWLLFFVYFVGCGIWAFAILLGRLGGGIVSEHFVRSKTIPRTIWMTCTQVMMIIIYLLFASSFDGIVYAAIALLGICYGVQFSIMIPTVSELFGLKHFGLFYNFMSLGNPLGAFLFSGLLAGYVYDTEAAKQQVPNLLSSSSISCSGPNCFRLTFLVLAGACGFGSILSVVLTMRIRPVYEMLYAGGSFRLPQASIH
ncbi:hypothetical protein OIU78_003480 [Salix suchowensis]|nr:hypothetical protein OIU78_003480 [Salix suchowensis]